MSVAQGPPTDRESVEHDGYFPPGSLTRQVIGDPAALIGGISALFLQPLHPRAMAGVEQHSTFPDDFWPRLQRTVGYVTTLAFADRSTADRAVARVRGIHRRVHGVDPVTGAPYSADDDDLLRWVHVCEVHSFAHAAHRLNLIDDAGRDGFLAEQVRAGALLGATDLPASQAEVDAYFAAVQPELLASPLARRAARRLALPPLPLRWELPGRPVWSVVAALAIGLLPGWAKRLYGLPRIPGTDRAEELAVTAGLAAVRAGMLGFRRATGRPTPPS